MIQSHTYQPSTAHEYVVQARHLRALCRALTATQPDPFEGEFPYAFLEIDPDSGRFDLVAQDPTLDFLTAVSIIPQPGCRYCRNGKHRLEIPEPIKLLTTNVAHISPNGDNVLLMGNSLGQILKHQADIDRDVCFWYDIRDRGKESKGVATTRVSVEAMERQEKQDEFLGLALQALQEHKLSWFDMMTYTSKNKGADDLLTFLRITRRVNDALVMLTIGYAEEI